MNSIPFPQTNFFSNNAEDGIMYTVQKHTNYIFQKITFVSMGQCPCLVFGVKFYILNTMYTQLHIIIQSQGELGACS